MDPLFEKVLLSESPFIVKEEHFSRFDIPWHVHPEYELTLISEGRGRLNVGDFISDFEPPLLLLLGPNLPHSWYGSADRGNAVSKQLVVQFPTDFLGQDFFRNPAFRQIGGLLDQSNRGLLFTLSRLPGICDQIRGILQQNEFSRTMVLLRVLQELAEKKKYRELSSMGYSTLLNQSESRRLNGIYAFILEHFRNDLDMKSVAQYANMTPQAFSRYFKKCTRKTFISFLNEVRIGYACRLLSEKSMSVSQVCFESGYSNLSKFNRQFKKLKSITPTQFTKGFES